MRFNGIQSNIDQHCMRLPEVKLIHWKWTATDYYFDSWYAMMMFRFQNDALHDICKIVQQLEKFLLGLKLSLNIYSRSQTPDV